MPAKKLCNLCGGTGLVLNPVPWARVLGAIGICRCPDGERLWSRLRSWARGQVNPSEARYVPDGRPLEIGISDENQLHIEVKDARA